MNQLFVCGNIGDPKFNMVGETPLLKFGVADNQRVKKNGEWVDETQWFDVSVWGKAAERLVTKLCRGSRVNVRGPLKRRTYQDKEGTTRESLEITVNSFDGAEWVGGKRLENKTSAAGYSDEAPF